MRTKDIRIGGTYVAKVSGTLQKVRITRVNYYSGWDAINIATGRIVHVRSPQRLRYEVRPNAPIEFNAAKWLAGEIQDQVDSYEITEDQARRDVLQFLSEGQYRDELTDEQSSQVWRLAQKGQEVQS